MATLCGRGRGREHREEENVCSLFLSSTYINVTGLKGSREELRNRFTHTCTYAHYTMCVKIMRNRRKQDVLLLSSSSSPPVLRSLFLKLPPPLVFLSLGTQFNVSQEEIFTFCSLTHTDLAYGTGVCIPTGCFFFKNHTKSLSHITNHQSDDV